MGLNMLMLITSVVVSSNRLMIVFILYTIFPYNITAHFVEETDDMYLDVFSCKDFDPHVVTGVVAEFFNPYAVDTKCFQRQAELREPPRPAPQNGFHHFRIEAVPPK
jgi:hypothetical protein